MVCSLTIFYSHSLGEKERIVSPMFQNDFNCAYDAFFLTNLVFASSVFQFLIANL